MLRAFWSSEKTFKKALTNQKTYDIIKVQKKERKIKMIKRIKVYFFLRKLGVKNAWKASGDKGFIQF